jgi:elongation factor G
MRRFSAASIRNLCLLGHGGVGKTALLSSLIRCSTAPPPLGAPDKDSPVFDTRDDEKARAMTLSLALGCCEWLETKINLLDTPGFLDLVDESLPALRVCEAAIVVVDGAHGVQVGTHIATHHADDEAVPKMFFINALDKDSSQFDQTLAALRRLEGSKVAALTIPLDAEPPLQGVIDLVSRAAFEYAPGGQGSARRVDIPGSMIGKVNLMRTQLMESVAESDDALLNSYFEHGELTVPQLRAGLSAGVRLGRICPVLCGSALFNIGIDKLLDAMVSLCPSPAQRPPLDLLEGDKSVQIAPSAQQPPLAFVFKTISQDHLGEIALVRLFCGTIKTGDELLNTATQTTQRLGNLQLMRGHERVDISQIEAGDICALLKLKDTHSANTLSDKSHPRTVPAIVFPQPLFSVAIEPQGKGDEDKIALGLAKLHEEDRLFSYTFHPDTHQSILSAMGETHLDIILENLSSRFKVQVLRRPPKISYRETISKAVKYVEYTHKKQTGGAGQYAKVFIDLEPAERGQGYEFVDNVVGGVIDQSLRPSVDKGIRAKMQEGILAGFPIIDVKVSLVDGKTHPVDSKDVAFQIAGREVFKKAFEMAGPLLLEPIAEVAVVVPDEYLGDVMGDLASRRGRISGMESQGNAQLIHAKVPESELQNYSPALRSFTHGRGSYRTSFSHYEPMAAELIAPLIAKLNAQTDA